MFSLQCITVSPQTVSPAPPFVFPSPPHSSSTDGLLSHAENSHDAHTAQETENEPSRTFSVNNHSAFSGTIVSYGSDVPPFDENDTDENHVNSGQKKRARSPSIEEDNVPSSKYQRRKEERDIKKWTLIEIKQLPLDKRGAALLAFVNDNKHNGDYNYLFGEYAKEIKAAGLHLENHIDVAQVIYIFLENHHEISNGLVDFYLQLTTLNLTKRALNKTELAIFFRILSLHCHGLKVLRVCVNLTKASDTAPFKQLLREYVAHATSLKTLVVKGEVHGFGECMTLLSEAAQTNCSLLELDVSDLRDTGKRRQFFGQYPCSLDGFQEKLNREVKKNNALKIPSSHILSRIWLSSPHVAGWNQACVDELIFNTRYLSKQEKIAIKQYVEKGVQPDAPQRLALIGFLREMKENKYFAPLYRESYVTEVMQGMKKVCFFSDSYCMDAQIAKERFLFLQKHFLWVMKNCTTLTDIRVDLKKDDPQIIEAILTSNQPTLQGLTYQADCLGEKPSYLDSLMSLIAKHEWHTFCWNPLFSVVDKENAILNNVLEKMLAQKVVSVERLSLPICVHVDDATCDQIIALIKKDGIKEFIFPSLHFTLAQELRLLEALTKNTQLRKLSLGELAFSPVEPQDMSQRKNLSYEIISRHPCLESLIFKHSSIIFRPPQSEMERNSTLQVCEFSAQPIKAHNQVFLSEIFRRNMYLQALLDNNNPLSYFFAYLCLCTQMIYKDGFPLELCALITKAVACTTSYNKVTHNKRPAKLEKVDGWEKINTLALQLGYKKGYVYSEPS